MIRAAMLGLGLGLGLLSAVVFEGRMAHLRALPGIALPPWTAVIDERAGLLDGAAGPLAGDVTLRWRLDGLEDWRPRWRLTAEGPGLTLAAGLFPDPAGEARFSDLRGRLELAALTAWAGSAPLTGQLDILRGEGIVAAGAQFAGHADGLASNITLPDELAPLDGRFGLTREPGGDWRLRILPADGGPGVIEVLWPGDGAPAAVTLTDRDGLTRRLYDSP